ncbi:MAG: hypothetical protein IPG63_01430 [Xanthomonadales bacterium]|nr:hypothetical protein [Xanthomonadales bacterium]MBK7146742.1 hypothetical protein [Xanthomonadales bacterium]MCC6560935.1 hypothetical protein [Xanthomonadales bacterium]
MTALRLDEAQRRRLLGLIGIDRYLRRGPLPQARAEAPPTNPAAVAPPAVAEARDTRAPSGTIASHPRSTPARPSLLDDPGIAARAPRLLLLVEAPRTRQPDCKALLEAIRRSLPAHRLLDAGDPPTQWPEFTLALAARVASVDGVRILHAPALSDLLGNAHAKRELWRTLKPVVRALRPR